MFRYLKEMSTPAIPFPGIDQTVSSIGLKVAKARAERGWSLQELGRRAGVSAAAIHKIEKSGMTPTIATLMKIAAALGKSVGFFIEEGDTLRPVTVVRRDERALLYTSKQGLTLENISGRYGPFYLAGAEALAEPGADSGDERMMHPGEELVIVLDGTMVFEVDGEEHLLEEGDSIHFRTSVPHAWRNPGEEPARLIWLAIRSS
jgi:transcriptional regulator with XRE-family HTH domain